MKAPTAFGKKRMTKRAARATMEALASPPPPPPQAPVLFRRNPSAFGFLSENRNNRIYRARQALISAVSDHLAEHPEPHYKPRTKHRRSGKAKAGKTRRRR